MKKLFFAFMLFLFSVSMYAQKKNVLGVFMNDGTAVCFYLSEQPLVTFVDDNVKIVSASEEAMIKRSLVKRFEFLDAIPAGIEDVIEEENNGSVRENVEFTAETIHVSGLGAGRKVQVFSLNGILLMTGVAGNDGNVTFSLDSLSPGIYVINYNETTIKFIKR